MKISAKTRKRDRYLFFLCVTVSKFFFASAIHVFIVTVKPLQHALAVFLNERFFKQPVSIYQ